MGERGERFTDVVTDACVHLGKSPNDPLLQAEQVMRHQHLAIGGRSGADSDGWYRNAVGDHSPQLRGDDLDDHCIGASAGDGLGIRENLACRDDVASLNFESAQRARGLGR